MTAKSVVKRLTVQGVKKCETCLWNRGGVCVEDAEYTRKHPLPVQRTCYQWQAKYPEFAKGDGDE